jgi:hypothetical protein
VSLGVTRCHLVSLGVTQFHLDSVSRHSVSLGVTWFHMVSLGFTWCHLVSLGVTWFHLVSLGFTWFHLVQAKGHSMLQLATQQYERYKPKHHWQFRSPTHLGRIPSISSPLMIPHHWRLCFCRLRKYHHRFHRLRKNSHPRLFCHPRINGVVVNNATVNAT